MQLILNTFLTAGRQARRLVILVVGLTVLLFGVALLVLPGPAFVVIPLGLGILSIEFAWAKRWLRQVRTSAEAAAHHFQNGRASTVSPTIPVEKVEQALNERTECP